MKHWIYALALFVAASTWALPGQAAPAWYTCEVDQAGVLSNGVLTVKLTHLAESQAFKKKNFRAEKAISKQSLAVALSAMAANLRVRIKADLDSPGTPRLLRFELLAD
ncbi:MAG: hypothetical protein AAF530_07310 [Pseudomonadota bacterium]